MRNSTSVIKRLLLCFFVFAAAIANAQIVPAAIGTDLANGTNVDVATTNLGLFNQYRVQATVSIGSGVRKVEFPENTSSYFNVWRTYTGGTLSGFNAIIDPVTQPGSARWNNNAGGSGILLPAITSGNYYTVNIMTNNAYNSDTMAILETGYNPVSVLSVNIPTDTNTIGPACSPFITATLSAAPALGEFVYLRYSTTGFRDSSMVIHMTVVGTTATCQLPAYPNGTHIDYYVMTSPNASLIPTGPASGYYDCFTLSLRNAVIGQNFSYTVKNLPVPSVSITASLNPVCSGTPDIFTAHAVNNGTVASDFQWYKNNIAVGVDDSIYTDAVLVNGDSVWVVITANLGCPVKDTSNHVIVTVNPTPSPTSRDTSVCPGSSVDLSTLVAGNSNPLIYRMDSLSGPTIGNSVTVNNTTTYIALDSNTATGCYASTSITATALPVTYDSVYVIASHLSYCNHIGMDTFIAVPIGGGPTPTYQWTLSENPIATGDTLITGPYDTLAGNYFQVIMTSSALCPTTSMAYSDPFSITLYTNSTYTQYDTICQGSSFAENGHMYTTTNTYMDTFFNASIYGCDSIVTTNLTVKPASMYTQNLAICQGQSITVGPNTYSTSGSHIDTLTAASANGCDSIITTNLTVNPVPVVNVPADQTDCNGKSTAPFVFTGGGNGTVYSWTNNNTSIGLGASGPQTGGIVNPVAASSVLGNAYGTLLDNTINGSGLSAYPSLTANHNASAPNNSWVSNGIKDTVTFDLGGNAIINGFSFWNQNGGGPGSNGSTGIKNVLVFSSTDGITFTPVAGAPIVFAQVPGSTAAPETFTFPAIAASYIRFAIGSNYGDSNAGFAEIAFAGNLGDSTDIPSFIAVDTAAYSPTVATITVTPTANGCIGSTVTFKITVYPAALDTQNITICSGQSVVVGAHTYTTNGTFIDTLLGVSAAGCDSIVTTNLTVNPTPTVNVTSDQILCNNSASAPVHFTGAVAGTVYNWTGTNGTIGIATSGTGDIASFTATNTGNSPVIDTIIVTPSSTNKGVTCTGTPDTFTITVNPTPTVNPSGDQTVCNAGSTTTVSFTGSVPSTKYSWTGSTGTIGLATSGTGDIAAFTATNSGNSPVTDTIIVTPSYSNGGVTCTGTPDTFIITVNPTPTINHVAAQAVCNASPGNPISFTGAVAGTIYSWTGTNGTIGLATNGTGNIASFIATNTDSVPVIDTIIVTPSYTNNGVTCTGTPDTFTITVNPTPVMYPTQDQALCNGAMTSPVHFISDVPGSTFSWTSSNSTIGLASSGTGDIAPFKAINHTTSDIIDTLTVAPVSSAGCPGTADTFTITIHPTPVVSLGPNVSQCGGNVRVDAGNTGSTFLWSDGTTTEIDTISTSGRYTVTVTSPFGCIDSGSKTIYIKPAPVVNLGPDITTCDSTVTLDAGNPNSLYLWSTAATTQMITVNTTGDYSVVVTDTASGCSGTDTVHVRFVSPPIVNLGHDTAVCGGSIILYAGKPDNNFIWSNGDTTNQITVTTSGNYSVTVTGTGGCTATGSILITIYPKPNLGPDVSDSICPHSRADLYHYYVNSGLILTYSTATPASVDSGTYTVIGTNSNGCSDTALITITYRQTPHAGGNKTDSICAGYKYNLTTLYPNTGYSSYVWNTPNPTAVDTGTYILVVTGSNGCTDSAIATITLRSKPNAGGNKTDSICRGYTYDLTTLYPNTGYTTYMWTGVANPAAVPAGTYQLIVTGASGCADTVYATITQKVQPIVTIPAYPNLCSTNPAFVLTGGLPAGGIYYVDNALDSIFRTAALGAGIHHIVYVYTIPGGCTDSATQNVTIYPQPRIIDTIALPTLCTGSPLINLNNYFSPSGGIFSGPAVTGTYFYPSLAPIGSDSITYIYTDQNGCMDTAGRRIDIMPSVHVTLHTTQSNFTICKGQAITFTAGGAIDYQFYVNDSALTTMDTTSTFTTTTLSNHDEVKVVGTNGCSSDTSDFIIIDVMPLPTVIAGPDTTIDLGQKVQLYSYTTSSSSLVYLWTPDSSLNFTNIPNPVYAGSDTIIFHLTVTDASGCTATATDTIRVRIPDNIQLPNVITPNGDGKNDLWILNPKINLIGSHLVIFNRWGEVVYETYNYNNDWGGTYKSTGTKVPDGTYYYVLTVPAQNNHTYKGPINVLDSDH